VNLPQYITITPTLIINKFNKPLVAQDAFQWVQKIKQYRISVQLQKIGNMSANQINSINGNLGIVPSTSSEPLAFTATEMEGMTDIFAYLNTDEALPQNYNPVGQDQVIFTAPQNDVKLNNNSQKKLHDQVLKERQNQDAQYQKQLKEIHNNPSAYYDI
jgi:hypothetical protein